MEYLQQRGVALNGPIRWDQHTALHFAALAGHAEAVVWLVERGVDAFWVNRQGESPLLWTAAAGHAPVVRELIVRGMSPNQGGSGDRAPLIYAVDRGYEEIVAELMKSPDMRLDPVDRFGGDPQMTPLSLAVVHGRVGIFQLLARNSLYTIPEGIFRHALAGDNVSIVREILENISVAFVWYAGRETETAIIYVVKNGSEEMLRYLLTGVWM
ncbi:ankyrin repeat-containing domain protein [Aspergillus spectabilis]